MKPASEDLDRLLINDLHDRVDQVDGRRVEPASVPQINPIPGQKIQENSFTVIHSNLHAPKALIAVNMALSPATGHARRSKA